ncbi:hypothetical protein CSPX01_05156 [Colletotrichum filicis]|nr:hypothetical protein CSPX01_05156 [Colletotrichum filicis]
MLVEMQVCPSFPIPLAPPRVRKGTCSSERRSRTENETNISFLSMFDGVDAQLHNAARASSAGGGARTVLRTAVRARMLRAREDPVSRRGGARQVGACRVVFAGDAETLQRGKSPTGASATSQAVLVLVHLTLFMGPHKKPCGVAILKRFLGFVGQPPRESMCHRWRIEALARRDFS